MICTSILEKDHSRDRLTKERHETGTCQVAFHYLKKAVTQWPTVPLLDHINACEVRTNASNSAIGVLIHEGQSVAYDRPKVNMTKKRYTTQKRKWPL